MSDPLGGCGQCSFWSGLRMVTEGSCVFTHHSHGEAMCPVELLMFRERDHQASCECQASTWLSGPDFLLLNNGASVSLSIRWGIMKVSTPQVQGGFSE